MDKTKKRHIDFLFDGRQLHALDQDRKHVRSWDAISGNPGDLSPLKQFKRGRGPLPEGEYDMSPDASQKYDDAGLKQKMLSKFGQGQWPGGTDPWGTARVWLRPRNPDRMGGRSGFSIHGGRWPGSAGCIDLVKDMDDFAALYDATLKDARTNNKQLPRISVDYNSYDGTRNPALIKHDRKLEETDYRATGGHAGRRVLRLQKKVEAVKQEMAAIEARMRNDRGGYFKDEAQQQRYRDLIDALNDLRKKW